MGKISFIVLLCSLISSLFPYMLPAQVVINEVMANPAETGDDHDEFIELFNNSDTSIDVTGWTFTDGDATDKIIAWDENTHGEITDPDPTFNTLTIPPYGYAVILDEEYELGTQPYDFPSGCVILTTRNTTLGNGLQYTDPLILYNDSNLVVSSYGTPEDPDDGVPINAASGHSVERKHPAIPDAEGNWAESRDMDGTPGALNSVYDPTLPVFLSSFFASSVHGGILLRWFTETEMNNAGFFVCRNAPPEGDFIRISPFIRGAGCSTQPHSYRYFDSDVMPGTTYYYLLEDINFNGRVTRHNILAVAYEETSTDFSPNSFSLSSCFPNPFGEKTGALCSNLELVVPREYLPAHFYIGIYNLLGQEIFQFAPGTLGPGKYRFRWQGVDQQGNQLNSGTYFWVVRSGSRFRIRRVTFLR